MGRGSNNGIILEAGRSYRAQEVLSDVPDKERDPGCPGWELNVEIEADTLTSRILSFVETSLAGRM
jgi:hypothetical protein